MKIVFYKLPPGILRLDFYRHNIVASPQKEVHLKRRVGLGRIQSAAKEDSGTRRLPRPLEKQARVHAFSDTPLISAFTVSRQRSS